MYLNIKKNIVRNNLDYIIVFIFGCIITASIIIFKVSNDFGAHRNMLEKCLELKTFPIPPLYYSLLYVFSFGLFSGKIIFLAIVFLMGFMLSLKYMAVKYFLKLFLSDVLNSIQRKKLIFQLLSFSLIIITPIIIGHNFYLGKIGINIWHNSTLLFEFPFAILLFTFSYKYIVDKDSRLIIFIFLFQLLCILTKPSYYLTYLPVFGLLLVFNRYLINYKIILSIIIGFLIFILEYYLIYENNILDKAFYNGAESKIAIAPFKVWSIYSNKILLDLLSSISFPLLFLVLYFRKVKTDLGLLFVWCSFLIGLSLGAFLIEDGPRDFHANFFWSVIISNFILFMYTVALHIKIILVRTHIKIKDYILLFFIGLHTISGIIYIISLFIRKTF